MKNLKKINQILKKYNITQEELAIAMKITQSAISMYFCGKRNLTDKMYCKILQGLWVITSEKNQQVINLKCELNEIQGDENGIER